MRFRVGVDGLLDSCLEMPSDLYIMCVRGRGGVLECVYLPSGCGWLG